MALKVTTTSSFGITNAKFTISREYVNNKTNFTVTYESTNSSGLPPIYALYRHVTILSSGYDYYAANGPNTFNIIVTPKNGTSTTYKMNATWQSTTHTTSEYSGMRDESWYEYCDSASFSFSVPTKECDIAFHYIRHYSYYTTDAETFKSYELSDLITTTFSGSFAANNLKVVTKITPVLSTDTATIKYTIGSKSETNSNGKGTITKTFGTDWYSGLSDATKGTLSVYCKILQGGSVFAEYTGTYSVTIPDSVKPSISALTVADRLGKVPSSWGIYVQNYSAVKINTLTYAAGTGSSVTKISLKVGSMVAKDGTPSSWPVGDTITSSGTIAVTVTVTDARGRTGSKSVNITVVAYSPPNFNSAISERCNAQMELDEEGNRFKVKTSVSYSSCNGKNSITLTLESRVSTESAYSNAQTITPNATVLADRVISPDAAYNVRLTLRDQFNTAYHYDYVSTALYLIHFHTGGTGIAFGQKASSNDSFEVNFDAVFHKETMFTATDGHTVTIQQIIDALGL